MERLKELRIQHGLLQKDVAIKLGVDRTTYVKYENGKSEPNHEILQKLADIFSTSTDYILGRTNEENHIMFSERLKKIRKNAGLTQEELASLIGVERSSIGKYESTSTIPSPAVLSRISKELNVTTDYLLGREEKKTAQGELPLPSEIDAIVDSCSKLSPEKLKIVLDICRILNREQDS